VSDDLVSVVIPTTGRTELRRAVESALSQDVPTEVIVAWDGTGPPDPWLIDDPRIALVHTGGARGAPAARNLATSQANGPWLALLDDDDLWLPGKLPRQLAAARALADVGRRPIVSCQAFTVLADDDRRTRPVPEVPYAGGPLADYLFRGRGLSFQRPALYVPTLLMQTELARAVPWDESLRRHQDWDWLLRASEQDGVVVEQLAEPLVVVTVGSIGSISASADWRSTWEWGRRWRGSWDRRTYADFMMGQAVRQALRARAWSAAATAGREAVRSGPPSAGSVLLGASAVVPRGALARVAARVGRDPSAAPVREPVLR